MLDDEAVLILDDSKKTKMREDSSRFNLSLGENTSTGYYFELYGNSKLTVNYIKCDWAVNFVYMGELSVKINIYDGVFNKFTEIFILSEEAYPEGDLAYENIKFKIYGGQFLNDPTSVKFSEEFYNINCIAIGYKANFDGNVYTVVKDNGII